MVHHLVVVWYYPVFTKGIKGEHLPNKSFNDLYFFENNKGKILPQSLLNYLFDNKKKINNYYIPDHITNILLLVCRNIYDKMVIGRHLEWSIKV